MIDIKVFEEPHTVYNEMLYKDEVYTIVGCCLEVFNELGKGFSEIVYKDALCIEFDIKGVPYSREQKFQVFYKNHILPRHYQCDFMIYDNIVMEIKSQSILTESDTGQVLNYLAVSKKRLGLLVNFGENSLKFKRIIL